ncbi:GreA/GreB family elongation factor [Paenibacillus sp. FA6]|uniref:GreA/GreB family elongation factor n=1 Tax=Paenibacillus sp. FA6 TaxID=3413029 RepID=UPI003F659C25
MNHSLILQSSTTQLVNQLVFFDEEKKFFLMQYISDDSKEQKRADQILSVYTTSLEKIISERQEGSLNSMVLIGSEVTLRYEDDGYEEKYTIVFPHRADPSKSWISFLSPMGLQLLMTKMNETYEFVVPSGHIGVKIQEIKYMNYGDIDK